MPNQSSASPTSDTKLIDILQSALARVASRIDEINSRYDGLTSKWAAEVRNTWIRSLATAFATLYPKENDYATFGGKPYKTTADTIGSTRTKATTSARRFLDAPSAAHIKWSHWEFMFDVSVIKLMTTCAAYKKVSSKDVRISFAEHAEWVVESELSQSGRHVAIDASKLRIANALNKLLIVRRTTQPDPKPWLDYLGALMQGVPGNLFIACLPTYSTQLPIEAEYWHDSQVCIDLYRCVLDDTAARLDFINSITRSGCGPKPCGILPTTPRA